MTIINLVTDKTVDTTTFTDSQMNFRYSNEFLKTDHPLIWEFPNLGDNRSEFMPQFLRLRFKGNKKIKKKGLEFELNQLRKQGNNNKSQYKIVFDDCRV